MKQSLSLIALLAAAPALADDTRQMEAHEHGVGALNIAIEGTTVAMEFRVPGADIVGFEHAAKSAEDRTAVDAAVATLATPLNLFEMPAAAECSVTQASAELESEEDHSNHDKHDDHADHEDHHDHDDHAEHDDHDHDEHAEHDDHGDHKHDDDHDDHEHHADDAGHTEFHAEYTLTCANPDALTEINFAYFDIFENAREVDVQIVTSTGAQAFEVARDAPILDLRSLY